MTGLGKARLFSATVAIVAVLAWFTGTNHCLLGLMKQAGRTAVAMSYCPGPCKKSAGADDGPSAMSNHQLESRVQESCLPDGLLSGTSESQFRSGQNKDYFY